MNEFDVVVKTNSFVCFLVEFEGTKSSFEIAYLTKHSTEGDFIREGLWHQKFTKMATSNSLSFMVLFMCKKHVMKHRINI